MLAAATPTTLPAQNGEEGGGGEAPAAQQEAPPQPEQPRQEQEQQQQQQQQEPAQQEQPSGDAPAAAETTNGDDAEPARSAVEERRERARQEREASSPSIGQFRLNVDQGSRMLRLQVDGQEDRATAQVIVGTEFVTNVNFDNQDNAPIDSVRVLLSYPTERVEPIAINDTPIADYLSEEPVAEVDTDYGMLFYEASLDEPVVIKDAPVISIRWKALRTIQATQIEFSQRQDLFSTVVYEGTDLLGNRRVQGDGTLNLSLTVLPSDPREAEALLTDPSLFLRSGEKLGNVKLSLHRQPEPVFAGEPFHIDLVLDNRAFSMVDGLSVVLSFDPEVLTILDMDRDNWITRERNIHDGPFREMWPWNMHVDNTVSQTRGIITYRKGTTDGEMTRGKYGPIARIWAVAKRPTQGTPIVFQFADQPRRPGTRVTYAGENALGEPDDPRAGTRGLMLGIAPARERVARLEAEQRREEARGN